jgi:hypothetical protein
MQHSSAGDAPAAETLERIGRLLDDRVIATTACARGYSPAERWLVRFESGRRVFAKLGVSEYTARELRLEQRTYAAVGAPFMPELVAWEDHPEQPLLLLEDLSRARWPPPWDGALIAEVTSMLDDVHRCRPALASFREMHGALFSGDWAEVARDPVPFLELGLVTETWLSRALPELIAASAALDPSGDELIHLDVRSDNLCRAARGPVLIDWNWACLGNGALDLGFWLPSLQLETDRLPEELLPAHPEIAASVSGFFAARAGLPTIADAPHVRSIQRAQLEPALHWAARELELSPPDRKQEPSIF